MTGMPRVYRCMLAAAVSSVVLFAGLCARGEESELKETTMTVRDQKVTLVMYKGRYYTKIAPASLESHQYRNKLVCLEGKFDGMGVGGGKSQVLHLAGTAAEFVYGRSMGPLGLIRGDNVWIGGAAETVPGKQALRVRIQGIVKLPNDMTLFRQRYAKYSKVGDWQQLINLGDWMGKMGKASVSSMRDVDVYERKQRQAYRKAMAVRSSQLVVDDAEGHYSMAVKYMLLLGDEVGAQRHLKKCLEIDPKHRAAQKKLTEFGYVLYDGRWMTKAEREFEIKAGGATPVDSSGGGTDAPPVVAAGDGDTGPAHAEKSLTPQELATEKMRMRKALLSGKQPEIDVLLKEAGGVKDSAFAVHLLRLLALRHDESAVDGINVIGTLEDEEVARASFEVLVWRPEKRAMESFVGILEKAGSPDVINYGMELLARADKQRSYPTLIGLLKSDSATIRQEANLRLRRLTGERFEQAADWRSWYDKNQK